MTDGFVRGPGEGERVSPAMTLKVGDKNSQAWSMFEVVDIGAGFDVGAHLHRNAEELFYVLEGQLDLWVPRTSSTSCDQPVFVDHATDASVPSDTVLLKIDRFG